MRPFYLIYLTFVLLISFPPAKAQDTTRLSLLFLGDIMQHDSQISDVYNKETGTYDYKPCFQYIKPYIEAVDVAIGNLEVTLAGKPYKGYPQFSAPDELLTALKDLGLDVIVTANNHSVDRGRTGLERTIDMLDSFDIAHTGTFKTAAERKKHHPLIVERQGFRLVVLNYTYGTNGLPVRAPNIVNMLDTAAIRRDLIEAKALNPDAIIVFPHWGLEYQTLPSGSQKRITELCFRYGAQMVIGSHPHVLQPMEWRRDANQLVAYSLGNFVSGQRKRYTDGGAVVRVELEKVAFPDGSSLTAIDTAGYMLEWVYRTNDASKDYYVLPVPDVETGPDAFVLDKLSREAFNLFVDDSRALFKKYNVGISELDKPADMYVSFEATDTLAVKKYLEKNSGVNTIHDVFYPTLKVGPLPPADARFLRKRIAFDLPVDSVRIGRE